jgi:hypothetical protein
MAIEAEIRKRHLQDQLDQMACLNPSSAYFRFGNLLIR